MAIKIMSYLSTLLIIFFLPEVFWERTLSAGKRMSHFFKTLSDEKKRQGKIPRGEELLALFPQLESKVHFGGKLDSFEVPEYKFYTALIEDLLKNHRTMGINLKAIFPELRINLTRDLQFEKKLKSGLWGAHLQFLGILATTWSFIILSAHLVELPLKIQTALLIFFLQLMGMAFFNEAQKRLKKFFFNKFDQAIARLYTFVSLVDLGRPLGEILSTSKVLEGGFVLCPAFSAQALRMRHLLARWKESGLSPKGETKEIIADVWHLKNVHFERFLKHLEALKFGVLATFFLPAYFLYLHAIFQFFMEQ